MKGKIKTSELYIGDALILSNISICKQKIDAAINQDCIIKSDDIQKIDLSGIQLLYYTMCQCDSQKRERTFDLRISEDQKKILKRCGFNDILTMING